ncbi:MAG: transglycosylase SLT domain-containing protein [Actinomycetota bacterium]
MDRQTTVAGATASPSDASIRMDGWLQQAIAFTGVPASWAPALKTIAQHESGLNPNATNGNDPVGNGRVQRVVGLMQMLPSTFSANAAPGHTDIYNPVDNLISAIRYIQRRYGEPNNTPGLRSIARGGRYRGY